LVSSPERFIKYLEELKWAKQIVELPDGKIKLRYQDKKLIDK